MTGTNGNNAIATGGQLGTQMRKTFLFMLALISFALSGCALSAPAAPNKTVVALCGEAPAARYFPALTFNEKDNIDSFVRRWYSRNLDRMEEPSLSCGPFEGDEVYRFLWLRTFHNPVAVRVSRQASTYNLEAVILDGAGGYDPGQISDRISKNLSLSQWQDLMAKLDEIQFWNMNTNNHDLMGIDGAQWIIEGRRSGTYHVVDRWGGADGAEAIGLHFLLLAGLSDIEPVY